MRFTAAIVALLAVGLVFILNSSEVHAQSETNTSNEVENVIKVKPGDTLSGIAQKYDTVWQRLFDANDDIDNPDLIYPGQKIRIPGENEDLATRSVADPAPAPEPEPTPAPVQQPEPAPAPAPQPDPAPAASSTAANAGVWDRLAECESNGNWSINTGNGFYGGLQFTLQSWRAVGGSGYPHQASKSEQINRAEQLRNIQGWGAWPACAKQLGLL